MKKLNLNEVKALLSTCYELEGLLSLTLQREDSTPDEVYNMIDAKIAKIGSLDIFLSEEADVEEVELVASGTKKNSASEQDMKKVSESAEYEQVELADEDDIDKGQTIDSEIDNVAAEVVLPQFSINDRYLFIRELFNGSEADFDDALESIGEMDTDSEVEDFLYNDLCLSEDNPVVLQFKNHILSGMKKNG